MDLKRLSPATMEWLLEQGGLEVAPASPLGFLRDAPRRSTPAQRKEAADRELSAGPGREALEIVARPEARIRFTTTSPSKRPAVVPLFVRGDRASIFNFEPQAFQFGPPLPLEKVVASALREVTGQKAPEGPPEAVFWPSVLFILTALWGESPGDTGVPLPREEALKRMAADGPAVQQAQAALGELEKNGYVEAKNGGLTLAPRHREWLQRVWSGHAFQVDYLPLPTAGEPPEGFDDKVQHLLFVGPPGNRVLCRHLVGEELQKRTRTEAPPQEPKAVHLVALPAEVVETAVRSLLHAPAEAKS